MMAEYRLDIFKLLKNIDKGNYQYFDDLSEDEVKEIFPLILMRWMSSTNEPEPLLYYLLSMESFNKNLWKIVDNKKLCYNLLCSVGTGNVYNHKWMKGPTKKSNKLYEVISQYYPSLNKDEIKLIISKQGILGISGLLKTFGYQSDDIKKLVKEAF